MASKQGDKVIVYERAGLIWIFNFHHLNSFPDYRIGVEAAGTYRVVLNSDSTVFGGFNRIDETVRYFTTPFEWNNRKNYMQIYSELKPTTNIEIPL